MAVVAKYAALASVLDERAVPFGPPRNRGRWAMAGTRSCRRRRAWRGRRSATDVASWRTGGRHHAHSARRGGASRDRGLAAGGEGRPGGVGGAADAQRPDVAVAVDVQEPGEADGRLDDGRLAREFDHRGASAPRAGLPSPVGPQTARGDLASGSQRAVRAHQRDGGGVAAAPATGHLGRYEEEGIGRRFQECGPGMAADRDAGAGARARLSRGRDRQGHPVRGLRYGTQRSVDERGARSRHAGVRGRLDPPAGRRAAPSSSTT